MSTVERGFSSRLEEGRGRQRGIESHHLERLAIVYIRQSTPHQVRENRESTALQYQLVDRAVELGWQRDRVLVIDGDLGQSGSSAEHRLGFQRLMSEVSLNHVGLVLGIEMSRFARSCKDWYQLLEVCALFRTLLADQDREYDPGEYSDRLLLGLSGIMSEAELHILRMRMDRGRRNKAARGELLSHVPIGYVRSPSGEVALDPDEQARSVVRLVFEKFEELGSGRQLVRYLLGHGILLPVRPCYGPNRGQLEWHRPSSPTLYGMLRHPGYAGAYSFGRSQVDPRRKKAGRPGTGQVRVPMEQWQTLVREKWPAYIRWEQFLANQQRLQANRASFDTPGAPREGACLLGGLVRCGKCGWRMYVDYKKAGRYICEHDAAGAGRCLGQNLGATVVDELVSRQILVAVEPAAIELSLQAEDDCHKEYQRLSTQWKHQLERARYNTERARRQYDAVEPENRLVTRALEGAWEQAILEEQKIKEDATRFEREWSGGVSEGDRELIRTLSSNIPELWNSPQMSNQDRQLVVRQLVDKVVVTVQNDSEIVDVAILWAGGFASQHQIVRPVGSYEQLRDFNPLLLRLRELRVAGNTNNEIADILNKEGFRTPKCHHKFDASRVQGLASRCGVARPYPAGPLAENEWSISHLARRLGIPFSTLRNWCYKGWIRIRGKSTKGNCLVLWADQEEIDRLCRLRDHPHPAPNRPYPSELVMPKTAPEK